MSTPIDPTERDGLYAAFGAAVYANTDDPFAGMLAVARAVLPEGYVAVPVEEIAKAVEIMTWGTQGTSEEQDTTMYFRSLLPADKEATS